jgi:hypothetical protein
MLNKYLFFTPEEEKKFENYINKFVDKKWSENKDLITNENMDFEDFFKTIITPLFDTLKNHKTSNKDGIKSTLFIKE